MLRSVYDSRVGAEPTGQVASRRTITILSEPRPAFALFQNGNVGEVREVSLIVAGL